jgi:CobQ-like glutamine amidotransferase family enzyme
MKNPKFKTNNQQSLIIGWLYPKLMNIYGDRGNIIVLQKRCEWRNINVKILRLDVGFLPEDLQTCDLLIMGGAQDQQQEKVSEDLFKKQKVLKKIIDSGTPGLYICGAYQFLGKYYKQANGNIIKGLEIFDLHTENPGESKKRLIGNISFDCSTLSYRLLGFENHGGRTYLGNDIKPFGTVLSGFGNNGEDKTEGAIYNNSFGTYLHGPILPKNPKLADYLIEKALNIKYKNKITLKKLDDSLEEKARLAIAKRLQIAI